ncbi:hypothetical protein O2N63_08985 [Aliiroseovarius sp. KMU-50]|uniref:Uncharacterized protein n=1 Tax=Aliiroseovarius salicola TaxID=3009082 RepID=A0ABT4W134_9RHOB|nr:hypothetical protein [Aliiroseovarius sp. KMU-50]MDA5094222.1 hypothetical protein [Aliiroseovarius sp. KMU-50]
MWDIELFSNLSLGQAGWLTLCFLLAISGVITAIRGYEVPQGEYIQNPYGWRKAASLVFLAAVMASPVLVNIFRDPEVPLMTAVVSSPVARAFLSVVALVVCGFFLLLVLSIPVSLYRSLREKPNYDALFPEKGESLSEETEVEDDRVSREESLEERRARIETELKDPNMPASKRAKGERVLTAIDSVQRNRAKRNAQIPKDN